MALTLPRQWSRLSSIFYCFLKIGPVTFGGGYSMIPVIEKEIVDKERWMESEDVADVFAVAGSVPGALAINSATLIGFRLAGLPGALAAMAGVLLPTFAIVLLLAVLFMQWNDHPAIEAAFQGIRASVVALICYAGYKISKTAIMDRMTFAVTVIAVLLLLFAKLHPVVLIVCGFIAGSFLVYVRNRFGWQTKLETGKPDPEPGYMMGDGI